MKDAEAKQQLNRATGMDWMHDHGMPGVFVAFIEVSVAFDKRELTMTDDEIRAELRERAMDSLDTLRLPKFTADLRGL